MKPVRRSNFQLLLFYLSFCAIIFIGCESKKIDKDKAVKIYVENVIAEEKFASNPDSLSAHQQKILSKYGVTKSEYENYFNSIEAEPLEWQDFFKKADAYIAELQKEGKLN